MERLAIKLQGHNENACKVLLTGLLSEFVYGTKICVGWS